MPLDFVFSGTVFFGTFVAAWIAVGLVQHFLRHRQILDHPNHRSSHATATPRGGGLGIIGVLVPIWLLISEFVTTPQGGLILILVGCGVLAVISWIDDLRGLPPLPRLGAQIIAVALGLVALSQQGPVFQGLLPPYVDLLAAGLGWIWFINLFNFMDGIDGIAGTEAASIGIGLFLVALVSGQGAEWALPALSLGAAAIGFLFWNWHPARVFLGDVGSVPLGYLLGWLLLYSAAAGAWQAALILPLYYLADGTVTLMRRLFRGHKAWHAHREHFYQKAVLAGRSHAQVVRTVLVTNLMLVLLAGATVWPAATGSIAGWPLAGSAFIVMVLLWRLSRPN